MKFEINPKPNKLTREDINIWLKKNCKKERNDISKFFNNYY